uniref:Uncharacterized protein n=1 Tax=Rousettus aegyptiacus TaxID=9407 RepID=A0A7J8KAK3_ROUAE|nr:hypothetical protein HJG63_007755 [Rousettus aegyptiacus]
MYNRHGMQSTYDVIIFAGRVHPRKHLRHPITDVSATAHGRLRHSPRTSPPLPTDVSATPHGRLRHSPRTSPPLPTVSQPLHHLVVPSLLPPRPQATPGLLAFCRRRLARVFWVYINAIIRYSSG